ncbi:MAG: hypothetical protein AAFR47_19775 [Pseudomonadota bacterium]
MASISKSVQRRLETAASSPAGLAVPAMLLRAYLRHVFARTTWEHVGRDALGRVVAGGQPVILAMWHARLLSGAVFWDRAWGRSVSLTSTAFPGRLGGYAMVPFGIDTQPLRDRNPSRADLVTLTREVRAGTSLVIQADGPLGPAREAKRVPLDWARLTGVPIWLLGFSMERYRLLDTWDRMLVPKAGGRGCLIYRPWAHEVPKRADEAKMLALRAQLTADLDAVSEEADRRMGHGGRID